MRVLWITDIHLNFVGRGERRRFFEDLARQEPDSVLLSGDIGEAPDIIGYLEQLASALRVPIYFVLGNHDFYHGSIAGVRASIRRCVQGSPYLRWLNDQDVVSLSQQTALVGHDSWADGRLGDFWGSTVELNDFHLIAELLLTRKAERLRAMQALAAEAVEHFRRVLPRAFENRRDVLLVTHVPPFRESAWHQGRTSAPDWLPFFSCQAAGEVLRSVMERYPDRRLTVLCGHTHGEGECEILPNLRVLTGGAKYRQPAVQRLLEIGS